jgi:PAS domain S-box-containing protein
MRAAARSDTFADMSAGTERITLDVRLLRTMFEAIWTLDLRTDVLRWAPGFGMFGYALNDLRDRLAWRARVHPEDRGRTDDARLSAIASGATQWSIEYRFRRENGSWADVATHAVIDRDAAGAATSLSGMMMDVTRERETARALRVARAMLTEAHRVGQLSAWDEDLATGLVVPDLAALVGAGTYEPMRMDEVWARVHPDDLARIKSLRARAAETGEPFETELRTLRDGVVRHFVVRGGLTPDDGAHEKRLVGIAFDITERKHAEEEARRTGRLLELVLETLPVGVVVMDLEGNIVLDNPSARRIWGDIIHAGPERYRRIVARSHESGQPLLADDWASKKAMRLGGSSLNELVDIEALDGRERTIRNSAVPVRDDKNQIVGAVVVNEDVTEKIVAGEELGRRERQQSALAQLGLSALTAEGLPTLLEESVALVRRTLGVEYAIALEWISEEQQMKCRAAAGPWIPEVFGRIPVPTTPGYMAWFYMRSQTPVVIDDLQNETRFAPCEILVEHGVKSGIAVPIAGSPKPFGVVEAHTTRQRRFTEDEVSFLWGVANVLATAIARDRSSTELAEKSAQLQALSRRLIEAQEAERRAVARELHDDFGQVLTALRLNLQRRVPDERENIELVDGAIARMRDLVQDLRPPQLDELGLEESLRWYVDREAKRAGLELESAVENLPAAPAAAVATTVFRVAQEALTNVVRHAHAHSVAVSLHQLDGCLELVVRDDGGGFDVAAARKRAARGESQGLLGMQERVELAGGELAIESKPGGGTRIRARLPVAGTGRS